LDFVGAVYTTLSIQTIKILWQGLKRSFNFKIDASPYALPSQHLQSRLKLYFYR